MTEKEKVAKLFVQNKEAFNLFNRLYQVPSKFDLQVSKIDPVSKINMIFTQINQNNPYPNQAYDMVLFKEMSKYQWDINFINNYVKNSEKFKRDLVR